jgi:hypothetical protein
MKIEAVINGKIVDITEGVRRATETQAKMAKGRGGPRPGSGPKVGPQGPADARLNIKCTKAEKLRWKDAAKLKKRGLSEFVRTALNIASRSP